MGILDMLDFIDDFIHALEGSFTTTDIYFAWSELLVKLGNDRKDMSFRCDNMNVSVQEVLMMERTTMLAAYDALQEALARIYSTD